MEKDHKDIKELLRNFKHYKVSAELDAKILKALENARAEREVMDYKPSFLTLLRGYLSSFNRYIAIPVVMVLIFAGGAFYYTQTSYSYHLNKAGAALAKLESAIEGRAYQSAFIPSVMAEGGFVDEALIAKLTVRVLDYTEKAIEIAERIKNPQKLENAFAKINQTQKKEVEVLANATEVVKSEKTSMVVAKALKNTAKQEESIDKAIKTAKKAVQERKKEVEVDIETSIDTQRKDDKIKDATKNLKEAKAEYDEAKDALKKLENAGIDKEKISKLDAQLTKANDALKEGKIGRVYGLSTAIQVKSRNIIRQEQEKKQIGEKLYPEKTEEKPKDIILRKLEESGNIKTDKVPAQTIRTPADTQKEPEKSDTSAPATQTNTVTKPLGTTNQTANPTANPTNTPTPATEPVKNTSTTPTTTAPARTNDPNQATSTPTTTNTAPTTGTTPTTNTAPATNTAPIQKVPEPTSGTSTETKTQTAPTTSGTQDTTSSSGTKSTTTNVAPTGIISPAKNVIDPLQLKIAPVR